MSRRVLTGVLLVPPVAYLIGWAPKWLFVLMLVLAVEIGLSEFFALSRAAGFKVFSGVGYLAGATICVVPALLPRQMTLSLLWTAILLMLLILFFAMLRTPELKDYLAATVTTVFGVLYVGLFMACLLPLRYSVPAMGGKWLAGSGGPDPDTGRNLLFLLFLVVCAGDIFAYVVGRTIGSRFLIPRVSPKKTVEGSMGGLVGSLLVALLFRHWFWQTADLKTVILLAGLVAISSQIGDLVESALKRGANLKDSGTLLPGHGGLLDRIDSLLFGAPILWLALAIRDLWG